MYEKTSKQQQQPSSVTKKVKQYLKILKVLDQIYLTISVVVIFKFV